MPKSGKGHKKQQKAQQAELRKHKQKLLRAVPVFPAKIDVTSEFAARGAMANWSIIRKALIGIKTEKERCKSA